VYFRETTRRHKGKIYTFLSSADEGDGVDAEDVAGECDGAGAGVGP
jgi:hypothetical protein